MQFERDVVMTQTMELEIKALRDLQSRLEKQALAASDWMTLAAIIQDIADRAEARFANKIARMLAGLENGSAADSSGDTPSDGISPDQPLNENIDDDSFESSDCSDEKKTGTGHGRNGSSRFSNSTHVYHQLLAGIIGALCAACKTGTMQRYREKIIIRIVGQPLFAAEVHHCEQARCRICGRIVRAQHPNEVLEGVGSNYINYHWSACAMLAVMHYFAGLPFKRLESLHAGWGIPFADANQWTVMNESDSLLLPLYNCLEKYGIEHAETLRIDDTGSDVIEIQRLINREIKAHEAEGRSIKEIRTGINATAAYIEVEEKTVVLFYTGRHHAGEIFSQMWDQRRKLNSDPLIKLTDGASKNFVSETTDDLTEAICNAHALLKFRDIKDKFPEEYELAGSVYKTVFDNDDLAKDRKLTPTERMEFHKQHSLPLMENLKAMCESKLGSKLVEPRSPLWQPITFIINQWKRLVKFCEVPGVPLDTNLVEQSLIFPVRYLAASFNFKNINGAEVGDRFMSLIVTALKNDTEPLAYLTYCLKHHEDLAKSPVNYLPWACRDRLNHAIEDSVQSG